MSVDVCATPGTTVTYGTDAPASEEPRRPVRPTATALARPCRANDRVQVYCIEAQAWLSSTVLDVAARDFVSNGLDYPRGTLHVLCFGGRRLYVPPDYFGEYLRPAN